MTKTKIRFAKAFCALALACTFSVAQAQPDPDVDPDSQAIPFDGGLSVLLAAGVAYAAKKGHDRRKTQKEKLGK